jgi:phage recombination protein Bet
MKKPCHIVPMRVKVGDNWEWRDVIMPGIYEYRTTAQKTGEYMGHSRPEYGDVIDFEGVAAPESCSITVYRWNSASQTKAEYPVTVWFSEVVALKRDGKPNERWSKAPRQMLTKCTEAAALREAFPDELGGEMTYEEMVGQPAIDADPQEQFTLSKQAATKIMKAMTEAIASKDPTAVWEIYQEQSEESWNYVTSKLDRWRQSEWADALKESMAYQREINGEEVPEPREKDQRREEVRAANA